MRQAHPVRLRDGAILALTLAMLCGPVVADLLVNGWRRSFSYFAADAFYYNTVARNFATSGVPSFDGEHPTNGFHPLWQLFLGGLYRAADALGVGDGVILPAIVLVCLLAIAGAVTLTWHLLRRGGGAVPLLFLLLPVGAMAPLLAWTRPTYGTLWSFTNGMESAFLLLGFSGLMVLTRTGIPPGRAGQRAVGAVLALTILARLDAVFLLPALLLTHGWVHRAFTVRRALEQLRAVWPVLAVPLGVIALYLLVNVLYAGEALPVSGAAKTSFPNPYAGIRDMGRLVVGALDPGYEVNWRLHYRYIQLLAPPAIALAYLAGRFAGARGSLGPADRWLVTSCFFTVFLGAFNGLFVPLWGEGHWYYPISFMTVSLIVVRHAPGLGAWAIRRWPMARPAAPVLPARPAGLALVIALLLAADLLYFTQVFHTGTEGQGFAQAYDAVKRVSAEWRDAGQSPRLLEYDDGIIAYASEFPALSGIGLALDHEASIALERGGLPQLAWERGYSLIASYWYIQDAGLNASSSPQEVREQVALLPSAQDQDFSGFDLTVWYADPRSGVVFIRMQPRR